MPNLSIKNVPEGVVEKLRQRAASNHRSLQGELMDLICRSADVAIHSNNAEPSNNTSPAQQNSILPEAPYNRISGGSGWLSIDDLAAELGLLQKKSSSTAPLAVDIIRAQRDSR